MALLLKDIDDADGVVTETRELLPSHYLVKIDSFSLFSEVCSEKYQSSEFETGGCKWRLIIYPNRKKEGSIGRYVSVYLSLADPTCLDLSSGVNAVFGIFLRDQISDKFFCKRVSMSTGQTRRFDTMTPAWGFSEFISMEMFVDPSCGYLVEDSCIFGAEVFTFNRPAIEHLSFEGFKGKYACCSWTISEYSNLQGEWKSEKFTCAGLNWHVGLKPKGSASGNYQGPSIAVSLHLAKDNILHQRVKVKYTLRVKDQISARHETVDDEDWFNGPGEGFVYSEFLAIADMNNERNGFVVKDCCIVEVEMTVVAVAQRSP